jgi:uncharacterized glyoxalase superfamily protein PhnB
MHAAQRTRPTGRATQTEKEPTHVRDRDPAPGDEPHTELRFPAIYPRIAYRDEMAALEFLQRGFGLREIRALRRESPDGTLAWLEVGDGMVMIGRAGPGHHEIYSPADTGKTSVMIMVAVEDVDAHHARAVAAGARALYPPEDVFYGDRRYEALDLEGYRWYFGERLASVRKRRGQS